MQPKMKPGTVSWWKGPNQKTEASTCFLFIFVLFHVLFFCFLVFFELHEYNQWRSVIFTINRDNSRMDSRYCCFMQNSRVLRLRYVLDVK